MLQGKRPNYFCGIDLGTTNSTVSIIRISRRADDPLEALRTFPIYQYDKNLLLEKDTLSLPSCLYFDLEHNQVYTGLYAKEMYARGDRPMQTIRSVKTRIGGVSRIDIPQIDTPDEITQFDMIQCSSLFLKTIRESLNKQLNEDIDEVYITVPAAFNTDERQATRNAALMAGFKNVGILDEPTAALLYYLNGGEGDISGSLAAEKSEYMLVYDIGGGTLDISIARIKEEEDGDLGIDIVARSPRMDFGGDDFDQYLAAYFLYEFERARKSIENRPLQEQNQIIARIVSKAEEYKIDINRAIQEKMEQPRRLARLKKYVDFEIVSNMYIQDVELTKQTTDILFAAIVKDKIIKPIRQTLTYADLKKEQISEVLLTGGMSKFYAVREALDQFFGPGVKKTSIDSLKAVSKGAAIHHYTCYFEKLRKIKMKDIMSDDLFIKMGHKMHLFIPRTTQPGDSGVFKYRVPEDGMTHLAIFMYSGIGSDPILYSQLAGKYTTLNRPYSKGETIDIQWAMDIDKILTLDIHELGEKITVANNRDYDQQKINNDPITSLKIN